MKKRLRIHPNACPKCGINFTKVTGIWRCETCKINKKYDLDDGRPREGRITNSTRIKALIDPE